MVDGTTRVTRLRTLGRALTTPLHPDDYLALINPLWSARELRGRIEKVVPETDDAASVVIRPGWGWRFDHSAGQYIGIGVEMGGTFRWRSYSLSSPPVRGRRTITITVKAMPEGLMSEHLVRGLEPGTIVRLAAPQGDFVLPDPPPPRILFLVGGSGITPVMAMLRTLQRRRTTPDVVLLYSSRTPDDMVFRADLQAMTEGSPGIRLAERFTDEHGLLTMADLDTECPDWRERETWACGPAGMLDAAIEHWQDAGLAEHLHVERFSLNVATDAAAGGTITFGSTGKSAEVDGATTLLEAGESVGVQMLYGCRMGICHTCDVPLVSGAVRDLRTGEERDQPNEYVQTCVSVAAGDCELRL